MDNLLNPYPLLDIRPSVSFIFFIRFIPERVSIDFSLYRINLAAQRIFKIKECFIISYEIASYERLLYFNILF